MSAANASDGSDGANVAMRQYWNEQAGPHWVEQGHNFEAMLAPLGAALLAAAPIEAGDTLLDVGCGFGSTLAAAALEVGPSGRAIGVDISRPMVDACRARIASLAQASAFVADAQTDDLRAICGGPVDVVISRFGVMFFEDPIAAFTNIAAATHHNAALCFVCWQAPELNPWMSQPAELLTGFLPEPLPSVPPTTPGPFAFRDAAYLRTVLERAGWGAVDIEPCETTITVGGDDGPAGATEMFLANQYGQAARAQLGPEGLREASDALRAFYERQAVDGSVRFPAAAWLVLARSR